MEGARVSGQGVCFVGGRLWQIAVFAAAGTLNVTPQAQAQPANSYWQDTTSSIAQPASEQQSSRAKAHHGEKKLRGEKKSKIVAKESIKPQRPLIISISIAQQKLRIYDANGLFAETPISTGMPGHPTPMGAFSVIQKQKFHKSNIYSGAPMPFMQRITWSGIAMHAGVLPGRPASHGCIRMPMAFAVKMYGWTKMGARVVVTPGDITPATFSHPLLATIKVPPQPVAVEETKADIAAVQKPEKAAEGAAAAAPEAKVELRPTLGHSDEMKPADESHPLAAGSDKQDDSKALAEIDIYKSEPKPNAAKSDEVTSSEENPASKIATETQPAKIAESEIRPAESVSDQAKTEAAGPSEKPADTAKAAATAPTAPSVATNDTPLKDDLKNGFQFDPASAIKRNGQIAVFVSRKDSKLYVRQNFLPLFNLPVTIAADQRPLGTHIFTAQVDNKDANVLHWSVVSLPTPARAAERRAEEERSSRSRKIASAGPIEARSVPVPDSPAEALDRLNLPAEAMAKIYEAVSTGGSIIVSDQGIAAGETGEGTDFIVSLR
jgi:lipoprotein-anchoring transpeptidase ErfK/SrfK